MCSVGSSKDLAAGSGLPRAIGGATGVGAAPAAGGTALTGARRVVARANTPTLLSGGGGGRGSGGSGSLVPNNPGPSRPGHIPY